MAIPDKPLVWQVPVSQMSLGLAALMDDTEPMQYKMIVLRRLLRDFSDWEKSDIDTMTFEDLGELADLIMTSLAEAAVPKANDPLSETGPAERTDHVVLNGNSIEQSEKITA